MTANKLLLAGSAATLMLGVCIGISGVETWLAGFGNSDAARLILGRTGIALPYIAAAVTGVIFLFASVGASAIRAAGWGVAAGAVGVVAIAVAREAVRLSTLADRVPADRTILSYVDPATMAGATIAMICGGFALRVAIRGNAAFAVAAPRRIRGKRAVHGEADWMSMPAAALLFPGKRRDPSSVNAIASVATAWRFNRSALRREKHGGPVGDLPSSASTARSARRTASSSQARVASRPLPSPCQRHSNGAAAPSCLIRRARSRRWSSTIADVRGAMSFCSIRETRRSASTRSTGSASSAALRRRTLSRSPHGSLPTIRARPRA